MYSVGVVSLGCSKNRVDTELMLGILRKEGYRITADEREADILIVNTCGFIEPAKQESIDTLLSLARYKQEGKLKLLAATGCLTQRYEQAILQDMPEVDLVLGVSQYPMLPRAIEEALAGKRPSYCAPESTVLCGERVLTTAPYTAYVRIADGCDNRRAYCAIPLIRGGFRSRDMQSVLDEIRALAEQGVKEHVLVAQDTSRFGMDTHGRSLLPELMVRAADIPGVGNGANRVCARTEMSRPRSKSFSLSTVNTARAVYAALSTAPPSKMRCSSGVMTRSLRMSSSVI